MLLSSVQVNKIWSELLPGYLIHFYSKWLGNFTEVGSVGSRVSSGFVSSCVSPSQLATRAMSPGGPESNQRGARSSNTAWTEDREWHWMEQEGDWAGACAAMDGSRGDLLVAAIPLCQTRMTGWPPALLLHLHILPSRITASSRRDICHDAAMSMTVPHILRILQLTISHLLSRPTLMPLLSA